MKIEKFKILILSILTLIISGLINFNSIKPSFHLSKQSSAINVNSFMLNAFSVGQQRLLSDFLWISTLLESDVEHYKARDLSSWMYLRFKTITALDPNFLRAYQFGGKYLGIVKDDLFGAKDIYLSGLKLYPNDYQLLFNYGFLLAFEINDLEEAINIYQKLLKFPKTPEYIKSLIVKLKYQSKKDPNIALQMTKNLYLAEPEGSFLRERLLIDIFNLQTEVDLNCLNSGPGKNSLNKCSKLNPNGLPYFWDGFKYISPEEYEKFQFHKRKK